MPKLKIGLPKGSLQESTFELLQKAGWKASVSSRSYYPSINDPELDAMLARPQEMSRYVEKGVIDMAITGHDWTVENDSDVVVVEKLVYAKQTDSPVRWVLAVPEASEIKSAKDLNGKRISTELVNVVRKWFTGQGVKVDVEFSHGATEIKVPHLADAIVDLTETGSSLKANKLRIVETVMESVTVIIANKAAYSDPWKKAKIDDMALMLKGALAAREKVGLKLNIEEKNLPAVTAKLPALRSATISPLSEKGWVALEVIIDERVVRGIIPELKRCGAEGIVEYPLNKVIP